MHYSLPGEALLTQWATKRPFLRVRSEMANQVLIALERPLTSWTLIAFSRLGHCDLQVGLTLTSIQAHT